MNPRKFYIGFPPAIAKTKRNGIEYGIGAIPLGGYVKIPGMHRPAAGDLDVHFGRAVEEQPSLRRPLDRLRERLDESDYTGARAAVPDVAEALAGREAVDRGRKGSGARARRCRGCSRARRVLAREDVEAGRRDLRRAGRQPHPGGRPLRRALHGRRREGDNAPSTRSSQTRPRPRWACRPGTRSSRSRGSRWRPTRSRLSSPARTGGRSRSRWSATARRSQLGPTKPEKTNGAYRLGFVLAGEGLGPSRLDVAGDPRHRNHHEGDRRVA